MRKLVDFGFLRTSHTKMKFLVAKSVGSQTMYVVSQKASVEERIGPNAPYRMVIHTRKKINP